MEPAKQEELNLPPPVKNPHNIADEKKPRVMLDEKQQGPGAINDDKKAKVVQEHVYFEEWCRMTGWHGVLDFYISENPLWKTIWLLLVLGGCFLAIGQISSMIMDFTSSDQWVTSVTYDLPKDGKLEWPNMSICGLDWIGELNAEINSIREEETDDQEIDTDDDNGMCSAALVGCGNAYPFLTNRGEVCCTAEKGVKLKDCFKLNPTNASFRRQNVRNKRSEERIFYLLNSKSGIDKTWGAGYRVTLYLGESDGDDDYSSAFYVGPGTRTLLALSMEKHRTAIRKRAIPFYTPKLPCDKKFAFLNESKYSRDACAIDCRIQFDVAVCNCASWESWIALMNRGFKKKNLSISRCATNRSAEEDCQDRYKMAKEQLWVGEELEDDRLRELLTCEQECPEQCEYTLIDAKISSSLLISPSNVDSALKILNDMLVSDEILGSNITAEELRQLIMVELYYESRQIKVIERVQRLSIDEFISNIGGCLGVWSGLSLLSIMQILIYLIKAMAHYGCMWRISRRCTCKKTK